MAIKALTLTALVLLANTVWAQTANESEEPEKGVEEILVTAPNKQAPVPPPLLKRPDRTISAQTRRKLAQPVQFGYDPQVEQILGGQQPLQRGQMGETRPVTVLRAKF